MFELSRIFELVGRWPLWHSGWAFRAMCCLLFAVALWRSSIPFDPASQVNKTSEPIQISLHLDAGRGFSAPFISHFTGPTAHTAPVFPVFLAGLWHIFGLGPGGYFVFHNAAAVALAGQTGLMPVLARSLGMHGLVGVLAALMSLTPNLFRPFAIWEANYVALLVMLVTAGICAVIRDRQGRLRHIVLLAFLWGVLLLANPNALLPYCGWLIWLSFFLPDGHRLRTRRAASLPVMVAIPILLLLPWTFRNYSVFGEWFFVRDDLGLELMVSNNQCAQFGAKVNQASGCYDTIHPQNNAAIAQRLQAMGEPAFNLEMREKAVGWIWRNPGQFLDLTAQRFWFFWFPSTPGDNLRELSVNTRRTIVLYSATVLSIPGLFWLFRRDRIPGAICLLWLGCFPLIHYIVQFEDRYRVPTLWLTLLLAAFALSHLGLWILRKTGYRQSFGEPLHADPKHAVRSLRY
jgi:hypothetical protein